MTHANKPSSFLRRLFPASLWTRSSTQLWTLTLLVILWFDFDWCTIFSFTTFQVPEVWVNALLLASICALPQLLARARRCQALIVTLLAILFECNILYARTYFTAIPPSSYLMAGNLADFTASVTDSLRFYDLGFLIIAGLAWCVALRRSQHAVTPLDRRGRLAYLAIILVLALTSAAMLIRRGGIMKAWEDLSVYKYYSCRVPMYTIVGSLYHDLAQSTTTLSTTERREVRDWLAQVAPLDSIDAPQIDNIVLILCESLESWPIGLSVEGREITPFLNSLAADSTVLYAPHVVSQVGAGRSIDAQLLINAGMHPMLNAIYATNHYRSTYFTLAKALKELRGAKTLLLTVDKPHTWNQQAVASAFGIDSLIANTDWHNDEPVGSKKKLGDRSFTRQIVARMSDPDGIWPAGSPRFIQIVTYSGHNPFRLPEHLDSLHLPESADLHPVARRYLTLANYTDGALRTLVSYLRSRPDFHRTLVIITGDHEGLAHDRADIAARHSWASTQQMVPLFILNAPRPGRFNPIMGQIDIYPSLLHAAGLSAYPWHGMGHSIFSSSFPAIAVDSRGRIIGNTDAVPDSTRQHIIYARRISDRIIAADLLAR